MAPNGTKYHTVEKIGELNRMNDYKFCVNSNKAAIFFL